MDGKSYKAARLAATLRRQLWREHLGLLPAQDYDASKHPNAQPPTACMNEILEGQENDFVTDPLNDELWKTWTDQASVNTDIYRQLFRTDPDDHIKNFEDYYKYRSQDGYKLGHLYDPFVPIEEVRAKLDKIRGHLVWMSLDFLKDAEMAESGLQVNQLTEVSLFMHPLAVFLHRSNYVFQKEYLHLIYHAILLPRIHFPTPRHIPACPNTPMYLTTCT
jgi:phospholipase D1/2